MQRFAYAAALVLLAAAPAVASALTSPLHYGDTNPDVVFLQQQLNASPNTQVAVAGPGSPGLETSFFGAKTLDAVKRFQAKHGIITTGFVGPLTLAALNTLGEAVSSATTTAPARGVAQVAATTTVLDRYVAAVRDIGVKEGFSNDSLNTVEAVIRTQAATTTDYTQEFYTKQQQLYRQTHSVSALLWSALAGLIIPQIVSADTGLPFGGFVAYVNPACTCSPEVQQILVTLPQPTPTSDFVLNYIDGTEAFQWHNLPAPGLATLGEYTPGTLSCWFIVPHGCLPIPAVGTIEPIVGSSATPL